MSENTKVYDEHDIIYDALSSSKDCTSIIKKLLETNVISLQDIYDTLLNNPYLLNLDQSKLEIIDLLINEHMIDAKFAHNIVKGTFENIYVGHNGSQSWQNEIVKQFCDKLSPYFEYPLKWNFLATFPSYLIADYVDIDSINLDYELINDFVSEYSFKNDDFSERFLRKIIQLISMNADIELALLFGTIFNPTNFEPIMKEYVEIMYESFGEEALLNILSVHITFDFNRSKYLINILVENKYITILPIYDYCAFRTAKLNDCVSDRYRKYHPYIFRYISESVFGQFLVAFRYGYKHEYDARKYMHHLSAFDLKIKEQCAPYGESIQDQVKILDMILDHMEQDEVLNVLIDQYGDTIKQ